MDDTTLEQIAELICGDNKDAHPVYRTGGELTKFFSNAGIAHFQHDGTTRKWWVLNTLKLCTPKEQSLVICRLASPREYRGDPSLTRLAISALNKALALEGLEVGLNNTQPYLKEKKIDFKLEPEEVEPQPLLMPNFIALNLEPGLGELLAQRWQEAQLCIEKGAFLSAIVMMGGLLEGLLLGVFQRNPRVINQAPNAPKDPSTGKVKHFAQWSLSEMIDAAHAVGWIDLDVKRFSHALRTFRNLIHPYEQLASKGNPSKDTCLISWQVVQATTNDLARVLSSNLD